MIQHQVTGNNDQSMMALANMYGCDWKAIGVATFGQWGASYVYPWLRDNGGDYGQEANVPTGNHWFFAAGMIVNIPVDGPSKSPPDDEGYPGGPLVDVGWGSGEPLTTREPAPDPEEYAANESEALAKADQIAGMTTGNPAQSQPGPAEAKVVVSAAGVGGILTGLLVVGVVIGIIVMKKKKGKKGKKTGKSRRRRR